MHPFKRDLCALIRARTNLPGCLREAKQEVAAIGPELFLLMLFVAGNCLKIRQFSRDFQIPLCEALRNTALVLLSVYCLAGFLRSNRRRWLCCGSAFLISSVICVDRIHYRFYGEVSGVTELFYLQALRGFSASLKPLLSAGDLFFFMDLPIWLWFLLASPFQKTPGQAVRLELKISGTLAVLMAFGSVLHRTYTGYPNFTFLVRDKLFLVMHYGVVNYHAVDAVCAIRDRWGTPRFSPTQVERAAHAWFKRKPDTIETWIPFGAYSNYNVILLQVESLQAFAVGASDSSGLVMPFLNRLKGQSISFESFFSQSHLGATADAEYCALNSLVPWENGAMVFRFRNNAFDSLPWTLNSNRYTTCVFVPIEGHFWNARSMDAAYGFQRCFYADNDQIPACTNRIKGAMDAEFLAEVTDRLAEVKPPFFACILTMSSHLPFEIPRNVSDYEYHAPCPPIVKRYLEALHYTDHALERMWHRLQDSGLLHHTVVLIQGDHPALPHDAAAFVFAQEPRNLDSVVGSRVPLIIYFPDRREPKIVTVPAGQIDLAPTIAHLLGIPSAERLWLGRNLVANYASPAYVAFANGDVVFERAAQLGAQFVGLYLTPVKKSAGEAESVGRGRQAAELSQGILELNLSRQIDLRLNSASLAGHKQPGEAQAPTP